jgi:hypothetical protein
MMIQLSTNRKIVGPSPISSTGNDSKNIAESQTWHQFLERFTGRTYSNTIGPEGRDWIISHVARTGAKDVAYLYTVHTHPLSGSTKPSERQRHDGSISGDMPFAREFGLEGIIVTKTKLGVNNGVGRFCEFLRTTETLTFIGK